MLLLLVACSDYGYTGAGDPPGHPGDGKGPQALDTAEEEAQGGDSGAWTETEDTEPCAGTHTVRVGLAADDVWEAWVDEQALGTAEHWWETVWTEVQVGCGTHVVSVHATDLHQAISGFIAEVYVDGVRVSQTGDSTWVTTQGDGPTGWRAPDYDDAGWMSPTPCEKSSAESWWGSNPPDLRASGAWWIWSNACLDLGESAFRMVFDVEE